MFNDPDRQDPDVVESTCILGFVVKIFSDKNMLKGLLCGALYSHRPHI